ncbi:MAG: response regulator [Elusimicrobia bacterium]|nr:response regulator [Elusimicrobiota bacterium]
MPEACAAGSGTGPAAPRKARFLVADDQEEWLSLISFWLTSQGHRVIKASKGAEVIPLAQQDLPDCFILDYDLGDMKGSEVCAAVKSHPGLKAVPVILLTAMAGAMLQAVAEGSPDHFVVKSQRPDELFLVLEAILSDQGR